MKSILEMFVFVFNLVYYIIYGIGILFVYLLSGKDVSEQFRKSYFADFFTSKWFVGFLKQLIHEHRVLWLKGFTQLKADNPNEKLKILEVGVGGGSNFELYPENSILTALDYNECFKDEFIRNIKKHPNIEFDAYLTGTMEDMHQIDDNTFDVVLITHVLCSVTDVQKGLSEVRRVLKEDGKFFFFEHVGYHQKHLAHKFWSFIQQTLNPFWVIIMCGCHLTRKPWPLLEAAGFKTIQINHTYPNSIPGFMRAHIWGWAQK